MDGPGVALPTPSLSGPAGPPEPVDTLTAPLSPKPDHRGDRSPRGAPPEPWMASGTVAG